MSARLPIGVVGAGSLGMHHAQHLATFPEVELIGVYDEAPARASQVAAQVGTKAFRELDQLFTRVRAVTIAVPTPAPAPVGLAALGRGLAVLIEKHWRAC
ncbi:MAG: Gfo/Idh/MocA family oxidoreductase [Gemmatimonadales bacterium]